MIALGKLGGHELNYSSDVDLIFLYDPADPAAAPARGAGQAALRIAPAAGRAAAEADRGRLCLPRRSAAAAVARSDADRAAGRCGDQLLRIRGPAVGAGGLHPRPAGRRRSGRSAAISSRRSIRSSGAARSISARSARCSRITRRIRDHYAQGQAFGPGFDLKRGRGGIREVEFFAQIHQLIHGGREPRAAGAGDARRAGGAGPGRPDRPEDAERVLRDAYRLLRTIEHRLQMVDDRQTHVLPARCRGAGQCRAAARPRGGRGPARPAAAACRAGRRRSTTRSGRARAARLPTEPQALEPSSPRPGFADAGRGPARIEGWRSGRITLAADAGRAARRSRRCCPALVEAFGRGARSDARDEPVRGSDRAAAERRQFLPAARGAARRWPSISRAILSHAPALAEQLGRRPELLDGLIDASAFEPAPAVEELIARLRPRGPRRRRLSAAARPGAAPGQRAPLRARRPAGAGHERPDRGRPKAMRGSPRRRSTCSPRPPIAEFEEQHGRVPGSELLILGLGRLGGEALTFASDLDLVYLFSGTHEARIGRSQAAARDRLFQPPRAAGHRRAVACRPRPGRSTRSTRGCALGHGRDARGHRSRASRAISASRPGPGSIWRCRAPGRFTARRPGKAALARIIDETLRAAARPGPLTADAVRMRAEIARHKPPRGPFDIKLGAGGLVDLEFAVHTLQLAPPHRPPSAARSSRSRRWPRRGSFRQEIDPALAPAHPDAGHVPAGLARFTRSRRRRPARAGRAGLRPRRLGRTACGARRRRGRASRELWRAVAARLRRQ